MNAFAFSCAASQAAILQAVVNVQRPDCKIRPAGFGLGGEMEQDLRNPGRRCETTQ
jgi:hypothetical protein